MALELFYHPLSSFCQKALVALYENETLFTRRRLVPEDPATGQEFARLWPTGKMPLLHDRAHQRVIPESSIIIEYLQATYPGPTTFIPADPWQSSQVRLWDRVFDQYLQGPMQKVVGDSFRPEGGHDVLGVAEARAQLRKTYAMIEAALAGRTWIVGATFTMADCAACPALFYADTVEPVGPSAPLTNAYLNRLMARASFARALEEAEPYFSLFPLAPKPSRMPRQVSA